MISRIKKSKFISKLVVATSNQKNDDQLTRYLKSAKISIFRGDLENVALRLYKAAKKYKATSFVRLSGDSPLIDPNILDKAIKISKNTKNKYDLITNVYPRTYPKGLSVEIIRTSILKKNLIKFNKSQKEHVTSYFYKNHNEFNIKNFKLNKKNKMKLSIDTKSNLNFILKKFNKKDFNNFKI